MKLNYIQWMVLDGQKLKTSKASMMALILILLIVSPSCKKALDIDPPTTSLTDANVYNSDATAAAVLTGIYKNLSDEGITVGIPRTSLIAGLSADEFLPSGLPNPDLAEYYNNSLTARSSIAGLWANAYYKIFITNSVFEGIFVSEALNPVVKQHLLGEARFMRAFLYFYLVNLFGDVPLAVTTDYKENAVLPRAPKEQVLQQIISDLKEAQELLPDHFLDATVLTQTEERVRPNKWAATALLARAYLYTGDYVQAEIEATRIIDNSSLFELESLTNVFLRNSREAIWQLQPVHADWNTPEARLYIPDPNTGSTFTPVFLSSQLLNSFEPGDKRRSVWVKEFTDNTGSYFYPYKYKSATYQAPVTEYSTVLRLAEQYLIRAEARIQNNKLAEGIADLNTLRTRATDLSAPPVDQLPQLSVSLSVADAVLALEEERRRELFSEWGHRWLDLKRTGRADAVLGPLKGSGWQTTDQLYPLPQEELLNNPGLTGHQNPGYN